MSQSKERFKIIIPLIVLLFGGISWYQLMNPSNTFQYELITKNNIKLKVLNLTESRYTEPVQKVYYRVHTNYGNLRVGKDFFESIQEYKGKVCTFHFEDENKKSIDFSGKPNWKFIDITDCKTYDK